MKYLQDRGMIDPGIDLEEFRKALEKSEIVEDRRRATRALGRRRAAHPPLGARGDLHLADEAPAPGYHAVPRAGVRRRAAARDARLRVRRQPVAPSTASGRSATRCAATPRSISLTPDDFEVHEEEHLTLVRDGARDRHLALDDPLRRGPLHARQEGRARDGRAHPVEVPEGLDRRPPLRRRREARADLGDLDRRRSARSTRTRRPASRSRASSSSTARTRTSRSS